MEYRVKKPEELVAVAKDILSANKARIFLLQGDLGAGKTTFIKAFCHVLGSNDQFSSPTFALVNEYRTTEDQPIFHFDFYRIKDADEALDIGFEEYLSSGDYCFIEWPEKIMKLLFGKFVNLEVKAEESQRIIKVHSE